MSIKTRLAVAVALVLLLTLGVVGVAIVRTTRATLVAQVDDEVKTTGERYTFPKDGAGYAGGDGRRGDNGYGPPRGGNGPGPVARAVGEPYERRIATFVYSATGEELVAEPCGYLDDPKPSPRLPPVTGPQISALLGRIVTVPAVDGSLSYRLLTQRGPDGAIGFSAGPLTAVEDAVARLVRILMVVGTAAMAVATLASWWLIRRGLRPVDQMVTTAAAIAAGDLGRRVPDADPRTELGRLGGALNDMLHQIEGALAARAATEDRLRRFVADAAHELRTPLTSVRGYAELHRQGALPDETAVANAMRRIEGEGARMARLVDDLLLLARLDQHRGLETTEVDLVPLAREAVADFGAVAPDRPVTTELADAAIVHGDRTRLRQVLDNLLANARTHTPPGTPVRVAVARDGDHVALTVADEGPGIPPEDRARVFERFWRADPARARSKGGTGLGLAIVASLVGAHGGTVDITGGPGRGSAFTVRLPLADRAGGSPASVALPTGTAGAD